MKVRMTIHNESTNISEKAKLVSLSRRYPMVYLEHAKLFRSQHDIKVLTNQNEYKGEISLPVASLASILLGPGCSVTTEAARIATSRGCLLFFVGGGGLPVFLVSTQHRSPLARTRQYEISFNEEKRLAAGKRLMRERKMVIAKWATYDLPKFPDFENASSISELLSLEGCWAKRTYARLSRQFELPWMGKRIEDNNPNNPIVFLNFLIYSLADICIIHLGLDPNIGILHGRTKGGGLCYDLADVFKPILALIPSMIARKENYILNKAKALLIEEIVRIDVVSAMIQILEVVFPRNASDNK